MNLRSRSRWRPGTQPPGWAGLRGWGQCLRGRHAGKEQRACEQGVEGAPPRAGRRGWDRVAPVPEGKWQPLGPESWALYSAGRRAKFRPRIPGFRGALPQPSDTLARFGNFHSFLSSGISSGMRTTALLISGPNSLIQGRRRPQGQAAWD